MIRSLVVLVILTSAAASGEDVRSFDVPGGSYRSVYSVERSGGTGVRCNFEIEETYDDADWRPYIGILVTSVSSGSEDNAEQTIRLGASPMTDGTVFWRHKLEIFEENEIIADITAHTGTSLVPREMELIWLSDGFLTYLVGNDWENKSRLDLSHLSPVSWEVNVSGVKGSATCGILRTDLLTPGLDLSRE